MAQRLGIKYETYRPKSLKEYQRQYVPKPIDSTVTVYEPAGENLRKQKENLENRLQAVGIDPTNLKDSPVDNRNFIEKALNLTPDQGLLMDVFEVLNRPQQAVKGLLTEGGEGMIDGLAGNQEMSGVEFLDALGIVNENELDGVAEFAVNLATDIAIDPLTYFRPVKTLMKVTGLGSKKVTEVHKVEEVVKRLSNNNEIVVNEVVRRKGENFLQNGSYIKGDIEIYDTDTIEKMINQQAAADKLALQTGTADPGTLGEVDALDLMNGGLVDEFASMGVEIKIVKSKTPSNVIDDKFFQAVEYKGKKTWVLFDRAEIKGLTPKGKVAGIQPSIRVFENADGTFGTEFSRDAAAKYSEGLQNKLKEIFQKQGFVVGTDETVLEAYQRITQSANQIKTIRQTASDKLVRLTKGAISAEDASKMLASRGPKAKEQFIRQTYSQYADDILNAQADVAKQTKGIKSAGGRTSFELDVDGYETELKDAFKSLLLEDTQIKDNPFIVFVDPDTKMIKYAHIDDIIDQIDFTGSFIGLDRSAGVFRLQMWYGQTMTLADIPDKKAEFVQRMMERIGDTQEITDQAKEIIVTYKKPGKILQFLNAHAADKTSIYNKPAKFITDIRVGLQNMFNVNQDFTIQFRNEIGRIEGSSAQMLYSYQTSINRIRENLLRTDPEAGRRLGRIIQSGATFTDGIPNYGKRTVEGRKIVNDFINRFSGGNLVPVRDFSTPAMQKNFLKKMNDILLANNINNAEFVVKRGAGGGQILDLVGDYDFRDIKQILSNQNAIIPSQSKLLNYGILRLDAEDVSFYNNHQDEILEFITLKESGEDLLVGQLGLKNIPLELQNNMTYLRHSLSREGKQAAKEAGKAARSRFTTPGRNVFEPRDYDVTIGEYNRAMRDFMNIPYDELDDDAFSATIQFIQDSMTIHRQEEILQAVLNNSVIQDKIGLNSFFKVIPNNRLAADDLGKNYVVLSDSVKEEFSSMFKNLSPESQKVFEEFFEQMGYQGKQQAVAMHNSVYELMSRTNQAYIDLPDIVKSYDAFLNYWKSITLVSPGFHLRNIFGNTTNMYVAGMRADEIGRYMGRSHSDISLYRQYKKRVLEEGKSFLTKQQLDVFNRVENFYMEGVAQTRKGIHDLEKIKNMVLDGIDPNDPQYKQLYQRVVKMNFETAEYIDDLHRYALYNWSFENQSFEGIAELKKYKVSDKLIEQYKRDMARQTTVEALFDYSSLTSFEKDVMKRLFPFYTFMKSNFVFQAKSLLADPGKYARIGRAYDYWNENVGGIKTEDMPDYMQDRMWLPIPMTVTKDDEDAISFLKLNLTPSDFTELVRNPLSKGAASITAPIKVTFELATGRDVFTGQKISEYPGQKRRMEEGEGVFAGIRDDRGNLAVSANPYVQKIINDLGLRVPKNYLSIAFDILDAAAGYQGTGETTTDILGRLSLSGTQTLSSMEITKLYQDLEQLRNLKSLHEQQTGEPLPTLKDLGLE